MSSGGLRDKVIFYVGVVVLALVIGPMVGAAATAVCALAGLHGPALVLVFGSAAATAFGAVVTLAALAAGMFFKAP